MTSKPGRPPRSFIRRSQNSDLEKIESWLIQEKEDGVDGNFHCNWNVIEESHKHKNLFAYVHEDSGDPVAFQLGDLTSPGIIQVKKEYRRQQIGQKLVEHRTSIAAKDGKNLLWIECNPESSIPFWKKMGFSIIQRGEKTFGTKIICKNLALPSQGDSVDVSIRFHSEHSDPMTGLTLLSEFSPKAIRRENKSICLSSRVFFHKRQFEVTGDVLIEVEVSGCCMHYDKAKRDKSREFGLRKCVNGYYIDVINLI